MIRRIFSYIGPYKKYGILAAVCIVAETFFELIVPFIMADMVDVGVANGDKTYIFQRVGAFLPFAFLQIFLSVLKTVELVLFLCKLRLGPFLFGSELVKGFRFCHCD